MKTILIAMFITILMAGVSRAQTVSAPAPLPQHADKSTKPRLAVIEFTSQTNNPNWNRETAATFQRNLIKELTGSLAVPSREQTQTAVNGEMLIINGTGVNGTAVKVGKLLGVNYVLTGEVTEFRPGVFAVKVTLLKIRPSSTVVIRIDHFEHTETNLSKVGPGTLILNQSNTLMKPVIQKVTASLKAADL